MGSNPTGDHLTDIFERQRALQIEKMGGDPGELIGELEIQFFKDMTLALTDELHEALNEIGWKPWATSKHFNYDAVKGELVDALHFFVNLCLVAQVSADDLYEAYCDKNKKNHIRQEQGYDGVTGKCPGCKRALDDAAVNCFVEVLPPDSALVPRVWCRQNGRWYWPEKENA